MSLLHAVGLSVLPNIGGIIGQFKLNSNSL